MVYDAVFHSGLVELSNDSSSFDPGFKQSKMFHLFNLNDEKEHIPCTDIGPDSCYHTELSFHIQMNSNHPREDSPSTSPFNMSLFVMICFL